jgi:hypothetical protein
LPIRSARHVDEGLVVDSIRDLAHDGVDDAPRHVAADGQLAPHGRARPGEEPPVDEERSGKGGLVALAGIQATLEADLDLGPGR